MNKYALILVTLGTGIFSTTHAMKRSQDGLEKPDNGKKQKSSESKQLANPPIPPFPQVSPAYTLQNLTEITDSVLKQKKMAAIERNAELLREQLTISQNSQLLAQMNYQLEQEKIVMKQQKLQLKQRKLAVAEEALAFEKEKYRHMSQQINNTQTSIKEAAHQQQELGKQHSLAFVCELIKTSIKLSKLSDVDDQRRSELSDILNEHIKQLLETKMAPQDNIQESKKNPNLEII